MSILERIDLEKVPGSDHHQTAVTVNCFILKMLDILNNFGSRMEHVLEKADRSLTLADRKLRLMEAKLSEVQLDEETKDPATPTTSKREDLSAPAPSEPLEESSEVSGIPISKPQAAPRTLKPEVEPAKPEPPIAASRQIILIKDDPAYSKYFKMLKMGVPEAGVIQKMAGEGVDPAILRRGDEPSRLKDQKMSEDGSEEDTGDSFSDSD